MRITRAAKVAAFPLTALILVALVACQGPAGLAGAKGDAGTPGAMGTPGSPGTPGASGISSLVKTSKAAEVILLNHTLLETVATLGSATAVVDVTGYFRGGKQPVTYDTVKPLTTAIFKVAIDKATGLLTVTATDPNAEVDASNAVYTDGEMVSIKAIDDDKIEAADPVVLTIKANKAPMPGVVLNPQFTVGTQNAKDASRDGRNDKTDAVLATQPNPLCATFASCVFTITLQDGGQNDMAPFNATIKMFDEAVTDAEIESLEEDIVIMDEDTDGMMFSIVDYDEKVVRASASGNKIMIGGVKSTWVAADSMHDPTAVTIMATDAKGLTIPRNIMVRVDAAPTLSTTTLFQSRYEFTAHPTTSQTIIAGVPGHFANVEGVDSANLTYTVTSSNHAVVPIPTAAVTTALAGILGQGTATVTITATDVHEQTVKAEFVVNVKPPVPA